MSLLCFLVLNYKMELERFCVANNRIQMVKLSIVWPINFVIVKLIILLLILLATYKSIYSKINEFLANKTGHYTIAFSLEKRCPKHIFDWSVFISNEISLTVRRRMFCFQQKVTDCWSLRTLRTHDRYWYVIWAETEYLVSLLRTFLCLWNRFALWFYIRERETFCFETT